MGVVGVGTSVGSGMDSVGANSGDTYIGSVGKDGTWTVWAVWVCEARRGSRREEGRGIQYES